MNKLLLDKEAKAAMVIYGKAMLAATVAYDMAIAAGDTKDAADKAVAYAYNKVIDAAVAEYHKSKEGI